MFFEIWLICFFPVCLVTEKEIGEWGRLQHRKGGIINYEASVVFFSYKMVHCSV
jgi:hypothetical protein